MRIVCISDTHGLHHHVDVPAGDLLVHAGDFTTHGTWQDLDDFNAWLGALPHRHKIVVAGNHDFCCERDPAEARARLSACTYLFDSACEIDGLNVYGSPWQPWFHDWAFNLPRGSRLEVKWRLIPESTDILITHGPPACILDVVAAGTNAGCEALRDRVEGLQPRCHIFGHIHEGYGALAANTVRYINASICNVDYIPANPPITIDL